MNPAKFLFKLTVKNISVKIKFVFDHTVLIFLCIFFLFDHIYLHFSRLGRPGERETDRERERERDRERELNRLRNIERNTNINPFGDK